MSISSRLAELDITLPDVVPPLAAYIPANVSGRHVYTSGQLPSREGELIATGLLGAEIDTETGYACARQCAINAIAAAASVVGGVDHLGRVVKVVGFVASTANFTSQPAVINGASELLLEVFGDAGRHARSAVGVASLPLGVPVEVEVIFEVAD
jgi:enamine deaminase RidA (YjgF/YER057c/UK114 family)